MSFRSFSRALPRSISKAIPRCQPKTFSSFPRTSILQQTCKSVSIPRYAAFSTSRATRDKEGQGELTCNHIGASTSLLGSQWTKNSLLRSSPSYNWRWKRETQKSFLQTYQIISTVAPLRFVYSGIRSASRLTIASFKIPLDMKKSS